MTEENLALWEKEIASAHSPGPVLDSEILYHQILNPTNLNEHQNGLIPVSFDTAAGVGMSTNRIDHATIEELIELGRNRARAHNEKFPNSPQPRSFWGFVPIPVEKVRAILSKVTNTRALFVYDTANPDNTSHADICQGTKDRRGIRAARLDLYDLVKGNLIRCEQSKD